MSASGVGKEDAGGDLTEDEDALLSRIRDVNAQYGRLLNKLAMMSTADRAAAWAAACEELAALESSYVAKETAARACNFTDAQRRGEIARLRKERLKLAAGFNALERANVSTTAWQPFPLPAGSERACFIDDDVGGLHYRMRAMRVLPDRWLPCVQRASALAATLADFDAAFEGFLFHYPGDRSQMIHASTFEDWAVAAIAVDFIGFAGCPITFGSPHSVSHSRQRNWPTLHLERVTRDASGVVTLRYSARRCCSRGAPGAQYAQLLVGLPRAGLRGVRWVEDGWEVARDALADDAALLPAAPPPVLPVAS